MQKKLIILLILASLILVGCGCSKKQEVVKPQEDEEQEKEEITLKLGDQEQIYKSKGIVCGDHQIQSNVVFSNEKDENGNYKGSYEFYECNDNNVNLQTAEGTYSVDDLEITFIDSYGQQLIFEATDNNAITLKNGSTTEQVFTK